ncbi:MAG: TrbI F-type domain-containing protein [Pseudomonadota bacterium]
MSDSPVPAIVHRQIDAKSKRYLTAGVGIAIAVSLTALFSTIKRPEPPLFISVSMKTLVEDHMASTIGRNISAAEAELRTAEFSRALDVAISEFASEEGVVVLASEAVVGSNVPDFTPEVRARTRQITEQLANARGVNLPAMGDTSSIDAIYDDLIAETEAMSAQLYPPQVSDGRPK